MFSIIMISLFVVVAVVVAVVMIVTPAPVQRNTVRNTSCSNYKWDEINTDVKYDRNFVVLTLAEVEQELTKDEVWELLSVEHYATATHQYRLANESVELIYTKSVL